MRARSRARRGAGYWRLRGPSPPGLRERDGTPPAGTWILPGTWSSTPGARAAATAACAGAGGPWGLRSARAPRGGPQPRGGECATRAWDSGHPGSRVPRRSRGAREKADSSLFLSERCADPGRGDWGVGGGEEPIFKAEKLRLGLGLLEAHACGSKEDASPFRAPCGRAPQPRAPLGRWSLSRSPVSG